MGERIDKSRTGAQALLTAEAPVLRRAGVIAAVAGLLWIPQAWLAADAIAALVAGRMPQPQDGLGFLALATLRILLVWWAEGAAQQAALAAVGRLRRDIAVHESRLARLAPAGASASLAGEQAETLRPYAARYLTARLRMSLIPPVIFAVVLAIAWAPALILAVAAPAIPVFMALIGQAAGRESRAQLDQMGTMGATLADRAAAMPDIRLLGGSARLVDSFTASADELRRCTMRVLRIAFLSSSVLELFAALGIAMMAVFCGFSLLGQIGFGTWGPALTTWQAIFLLLLAPEFFQPLRDFAAVWHDRAGADALALAWAERQAETDQIMGQGTTARPVVNSGLRLRGVARHGIFYPDLDLPPGASLALTGPSGSGKTTLLRLIAGLERPDTGMIEVGGRVLDGDCADGWRAGLGWMPQAPHFLDASVADNLRMGRIGDLSPVLEAAQASHVVANLPEGLATRLGENGAGVSGGEARRLMLARALFAAPRLILADEPTADLDAATAAQVAHGLIAAQAGGAGLIVATHDPELAARMSLRLDLGPRA